MRVILPMIILGGVLVYLVLFILSHTRRRERPEGLSALLSLHAEYTAKAARASRRGKEGEANVWTEAAANLWRQVDKAAAVEAPSYFDRPVDFDLTENRQPRKPPPRSDDVRIPEHLRERAERRRQELRDREAY